MVTIDRPRRRRLRFAGPCTRARPGRCGAGRHFARARIAPAIFHRVACATDGWCVQAFFPARSLLVTVNPGLLLVRRKVVLTACPASPIGQRCLTSALILADQSTGHTPPPQSHPLHQACRHCSLGLRTHSAHYRSDTGSVIP